LHDFLDWPRLVAQSVQTVSVVEKMARLAAVFAAIACTMAAGAGGSGQGPPCGWAHPTYEVATIFAAGAVSYVIVIV
jgi:hypothetical protein